MFASAPANGGHHRDPKLYPKPEVCLVGVSWGRCARKILKALSYCTQAPLLARSEENIGSADSSAYVSA